MAFGCKLSDVVYLSGATAVRGCEPWFSLWLAVSLLPTVAAFCLFLPSRMAATAWRGLWWGACTGITRWCNQVGIFLQRSSSAFLWKVDSCFSGHPCCGCCQPEDGQSSTGSVVVIATCATTPLSQSTIKQNKTSKMPMKGIRFSHQSLDKAKFTDTFPTLNVIQTGGKKWDHLMNKGLQSAMRSKKRFARQNTLPPEI